MLCFEAQKFIERKNQPKITGLHSLLSIQFEGQGYVMDCPSKPNNRELVCVNK